MRARNWLICLLLLCPAGLARAAEGADQTLSPYFFVEGTDGVEAFPLESTRVTANVNGVIADVKVEQTYRNGGQKAIHARYVFPASTRAAVHGMQFQVGDRRVTAKIKEREQAAQEYKEAAAAGKTASLLEQQRPNVFTMSVANILPGERVIVELRYSELLIPNDGTYQFVYPTVVGPRYAGGASSDSANAFVASSYMHSGDVPPAIFTLTANLSTGVPIADVRSPSHAIALARADPASAQVTLDAEQGFVANRDFILEYRLAGTAIQSGLLLYEGEQEKHFLLMVQPPARVQAAEIPAREYVFVLDVSGSMEGFPLDTAKLLIADLIGHLRPTDSFNVLLFSGDSQLLAPRSLPATQANVQRASTFISRQRGSGGTELGAALERAFQLPRSEHVSRSVVVLTDGYIAQERSAFERVAQNLENTNVFAFGIGSSVNRFLIDGLARAGQGEPFVVTTPGEAAKTAKRFRRYIESPVLTEIDVKFHGFDAYDLEPSSEGGTHASIPDLFAERPVVLFGKWRGEQTGEIELVGRTASAPFNVRLAVADAPARSENAALPQLWARTRIARLSDYAVESEDARLTRAVTDLGLRYSLLTRYTSFIAVLELIRNPNQAALQVDQPLPLPQGVSELAVGGQYNSGAEPELIWLVLGMLASLGGLQLRRAARKAA
jgi:Ca-activated chloride channel family protein